MCVRCIYDNVTVLRHTVGYASLLFESECQVIRRLTHNDMN